MGASRPSGTGVVVGSGVGELVGFSAVAAVGFDVGAGVSGGVCVAAAVAAGVAVGSGVGVGSEQAAMVAKSASTMSVAGMRVFSNGVSFSSWNPPSILPVAHHIPFGTRGVPEAYSNRVRLAGDWAGTGVPAALRSEDVISAGVVVTAAINVASTVSVALVPSFPVPSVAVMTSSVVPSSGAAPLQAIGAAKITICQASRHWERRGNIPTGRDALPPDSFPSWRWVPAQSPFLC